jgi:hypothetical protein
MVFCHLSALEADVASSEFCQLLHLGCVTLYRLLKDYGVDALFILYSNIYVLQGDGESQSSTSLVRWIECQAPNRIQPVSKSTEIGKKGGKHLFVQARMRVTARNTGPFHLHHHIRQHIGCGVNGLVYFCNL